MHENRRLLSDQQKSPFSAKKVGPALAEHAIAHL